MPGGKFRNIGSLIGKCQLIKNKNSVFDEFTNLITNVPVEPDTLPYMVLGRDSIFRKFNIRFIEVEEKIMLKRI